METWLAARTRSRYEKSVLHQLEVRSISSYLPLVRERHRWKDRKVIVETVLIPGYCFAQGGTEIQRAILSIPGVCGFVTFQQKPAEIPNHEIEMLRAATAGNFMAREHVGFQLRQAVRVVGTPFDGYVGTVNFTSGFRVRVVIPISIGKSISVELQAENVEPLPSHGISDQPPSMIEVPMGIH
jgi:transcription antitermination factor NusG